MEESKQRRIEFLNEMSVAIEKKILESYTAGFQTGYEAALKRYAWWKDGVQYVGTSGRTLKSVLDELEAGTEGGG